MSSDQEFRTQYNQRMHELAETFVRERTPELYAGLKTLEADTYGRLKIEFDYDSYYGGPHIQFPALNADDSIHLLLAPDYVGNRDNTRVAFNPHYINGNEGCFREARQQMANRILLTSEKTAEILEAVRTKATDKGFLRSEGITTYLEPSQTQLTKS